jgi:hypothetical protein
LIKELHGAVIDLSSRRNDQLIQWGLGVIAILITALGYLLGTYVIK